MASVGQKRATLEDLYRTAGQAELIGGRIIEYMAAGWRPNRVASAIFGSLAAFAAISGRGEAYTGTLAYAIPELPSGRESFSPDASYYDGPFPDNPMRFIEGAPTFAAEVRSENDYGPAAEAEMAAKRADYFLAGTLVAWDVDPLADLIHVYRAEDPSRSTTYRRGRGRGSRAGGPWLASPRQRRLRLNPRPAVKTGMRTPAMGTLVGGPPNEEAQRQPASGTDEI
jgi:Uma2 family endonuclease